MSFKIFSNKVTALEGIVQQFELGSESDLPRSELKIRYVGYFSNQI